MAVEKTVDEVFIVVRRLRGSDDPWEQYTTWTSRTGRPYVKPGPAKAIASERNNAPARWSDEYEYDVKRGVVQWDAHPISAGTV